jgi:antitoxin PrlF
MLVTVTDKGQLTVPKALRDRFGIQPGDKMDFEPMPDGTMRVRVLTRGARSLFGMLKKPEAKAKSIAEMDQGIADAMIARRERSTK